MCPKTRPSLLVPVIIGILGCDRIPSGPEGRWQKERLHLSPFLHREVDGVAVYNDDFAEGGHYADPIYGQYVMDPVCE